ncbi:MAG: hypothetical protein M1836_007803 [Candelina mexicana]|nr:MAG: hypothetical protein M1836_007803 [Candelina mexicana]
MATAKLLRCALAAPVNRKGGANPLDELTNVDVEDEVVDAGGVPVAVTVFHAVTEDSVTMTVVVDVL